MLSCFSCLLDIAVQLRTRNYKKKTNRDKTSSTKMKQAIKIVVLEGKTIRSVAKYSMCAT